jgi:hypothetical protein
MPLTLYFSMNGERYRQSLDTTDWREAQSNAKELIRKATADSKQLLLL